ncbi:hypothetical protein ACRRTK_009937 [Alexandromys fortis]
MDTLTVSLELFLVVQQPEVQWDWLLAKPIGWYRKRLAYPVAKPSPEDRGLPGVIVAQHSPYAVHHNLCVNKVFEKAETLKIKILEGYGREYEEYLAEKNRVVGAKVSQGDLGEEICFWTFGDEKPPGSIVEMATDL